MLSTQKISKQVVPIPLLQKIFKIHIINYVKLSQLWVTRNRPNFMVETERWKMLKYLNAPFYQWFKNGSK